MNMIMEVKKIEQEARELEEQYDSKLVDMEDNTDSKIAEMKNSIEEDIQNFQKEQDETKQQKLELMKDLLKAEEKQEKDSLLNVYENRYAELVAVVVEEVKKQYGNS